MRFRRRSHGRRLERSGKIFLVAVVAALLAAWNSGTSLYYLLFGGMASFVLVSVFLSRWGVQRLTVEREAPQAVHRGEAFGLVIRVSNPRRLLPSMAVRVEFADAPGKTVGYFPTIPPGRTGQLRITQQYDKRGLYVLPDVVLATSFPFGLIAARIAHHDHCEVVVYPRVLAARTAVVERAGGVGEMPKVYRGSGDEFFSLREYIPGDDPRRIAWRVSARSQTLLVKELELQTARHVVFVLETRWMSHVTDFSDRFEEAIELVASLAVTLLNRQYYVSVVTANRTLGEGEGKAHALKVLDLLARLEPADPGDDDPLTRALSMSDARGACYLTVSPDPGEWGHVRAGGSVRVLDPREVIHA